MFMELARFKRLAVDSRRAGQAISKRVLPEIAQVRKEYLGPAEAMADRQFRFTVSTAAVDRALDTIDQSGWDLTGYQRNPVVLWNHGASELGDVPIGRCIEIGVEGGALKATVEIDPEDDPISGPWSEMICRKLRRGSLSATSVGFYPIDFDVTTDPARGADDWLPGFDFKRQDLFEFSIVTVPCNREAVLDPANREDEDPMASIREIVSASAPAPTARAKALRRLQFDRRFPA